jgi:hypothetical protein
MSYRRDQSCGKQAALSVFVLAAVGLAAASGLGAEPLLQKLKPQHPRLLVDQAGFETLGRRVQSDPVLRDWDRHLRREADKLLTAPLPQHVIPDGLRLLATSRSVMSHTYTLALAYRLHHEPRYADRLWRELKTVAEFADWNPRHFLDTAEMTHAVAMGYDWLYDHWTAAQRAVLRAAIVRHGLQPGLVVYRRGRGWARSIHNWNQVCNGGLTVGALAIADEEPRLAEEILRNALASVPLAMRSYAPDGAWGEGPSYWNYATTYNVLMLAALESALGDDHGLAKMEGFRDTGLFPIYMTGPTGRTFNFSDSGDRVGRADCLFWLAQRFDRPVYAWFATAVARPGAQGMVWYRAPGQDPAGAGLPLDKYWRGIEVVTLRSDWSDPQALFVGIQAGSNRINHNHLDLGSFVFDAFGQRWAFDLGADDYNLPGYFSKKRYDYYRLRAEGHNTLVINPGAGPDQDPSATARIVRFASRPERAFAIADLTPAYAQHAQRVQRGLALLDRRALLVQDEVEAQPRADVWWFLHTTALIELAADGRSATLTQGKAKLLAQLLAPADARFEVCAAAPLATSPHPEGQRANEGFRKLAVHLPQLDRLQLAVLLTPWTGKAAPSKCPALVPLSNW